MGKAILSGMLSLWLAAGIGCTRSNQQPAPESVGGTPPAAPPASQTAKVKYHQGRGRVLEIDAKGRYIVIRHQEIKDFMDAMTMPFHPASPALPKTVQVGDEVEFTLEETADEVRLTAIRRVPRP